MHEIEKEEGKHIDVADTWMTGTECSGSSSKVSPQIESEETFGKTKFIVLQKNMRSMNSSERIEELSSELHQVTSDAILISETWRQGKEIWETQQGHIMVESGKFTNKHGVAILLNKRWKKPRSNGYNAFASVWSHCRSQSTNNLSPWWACTCHTVAIPTTTSRKLTKQSFSTIGKEKCMKIIGGDFNAELGPGEGIELSSVGHYTLNKANCRGEWMTQWLLDNISVAMNTKHKKVPQKHVTYHTPKSWKAAGLHSDRQKALFLEQRRGSKRHNTHGQWPQMCYSQVRN